MRPAIFFALLAVLVGFAWATWPTHPTDSLSCEIARSTGIELELDIERCEQALQAAKAGQEWPNVFIHRQITLINANLPEEQFTQFSAEFRSRTDERYAAYDMSTLRHTAVLGGVLVLMLLATALGRRKYGSAGIQGA